MQLIADTHVHMYPCYDYRMAFQTLVENLRVLQPSAMAAAFLAERHDCRFFQDLALGRIPENRIGLTIEPTHETNALVLKKNKHAVLYLFAGRQIACAERIEVLALTVDAAISDNLPAVDAIEAVLDAGGMPVLSWAPGKWLFRRARVVADILEKATPGRLLIGDSSLRPPLWKTPRLMQQAQHMGFGTIAGSDPLPFSGEEHYLGTFGSIIPGAFDPVKPVSSVRTGLGAHGDGFTRMGKRCSLLQTIRRVVKNACTK
jgi:hypothetical protein